MGESPMATMATPTLQPEMLVVWPDAATAHDPFRFGWRTVRRERPDGTIEFARQPLTLEDVLHPEEEDFIVQGTVHHQRRRSLANILDAQNRSDPHAVSLFDCRIDWRVPGLRPHGPDLAVVFGVRERKNWHTFRVADEGALPELVIEVTSPATVALDRSTKLDHYAEAGVRYYVVVDGIASGRQAPVRLLGYELRGGRYQPLPLDERGRLWLAQVRIWLGSEGGEIACYDEQGQRLGDYPALVRARAAAEERAAEAEQRATDEAITRVVAEDRAAEAEAQAADLAAQLRAMEAEMRRLRGESS